MIAIDTDEKFKWFLDALESDDFQVVSRKWTKEEKEELSREIAEYKAMRETSTSMMLCHKILYKPTISYFILFYVNFVFFIKFFCYFT